jgi:hypothetical protein
MVLDVVVTVVAEDMQGAGIDAFQQEDSNPVFV